ncbi:porphobilinogen deaminase [Orientia chuto str. Dubai]|uniref:Porphobilinogen deaminase n=1 Tax=Orientia chuto str. Dubai TaxID=1359168 RepID=A0A0F3MJA6_9RICK|nr:hydroxymethylbilane synthase [Candidatus Orientia mediorientalis]KJV55858.1 porphobilinogen deaminase [Orientia chuto str. Dubai]
MIIKVGSRASRLALLQAQTVVQKIKDLLGLNAIIIPIRTTGDLIQNKNLYDIGGKGLFLKEIEYALLNNTIDIAVHSLKDVPAYLPDELEIAAVLERGDTGDMLVSKIAKKITDLPLGAVVGTSSIRRRIQLLMIRPDLNIVLLRGNVDTRWNKIANNEVDATVLAVAGLKKLNYDTSPWCSIIPQSELLPAIGQGTVAIEIRKDNKSMIELCSKINHQLTWQLVQVERSYLKTLNADCTVPIGGLAKCIGNNRFEAKFMLGDYDMRYFFYSEVSGKLQHGYNIGVEVAKNFQKRLFIKLHKSILNSVTKPKMDYL